MKAWLPVNETNINFSLATTNFTGRGDNGGHSALLKRDQNCKSLAFVQSVLTTCEIPKGVSGELSAGKGQ